MHNWRYPSEKLYDACLVAIGNSERPQERLRSAAWDVSLLLHNAEIPDEDLRRRMEQLVATCSSKPSQGAGTLPATTSQMTDEAAGGLLREVFSIFVKVAELEALEGQHLL
jgi:hypothetical protein